MTPLLSLILVLPAASQDLFLAAERPVQLTTKDAVATFTSYRLDGDAVCLNGLPGEVKVFVNPSPSTTWVLNFGMEQFGLGENLCISEKACSSFGAKNGVVPPSPPPTPPAPVNGGTSIMGQNCTTNPTFCTANQVILNMCDFSLGLGDAVTTTSDGTVLHFKGQALLKGMVNKLSTLGLAKAEKILLTGAGFGGTMVFLHADAIGAMVKAAAPGLKVYKALPVDGFKVNMFTSFLFPPFEKQVDTWLTPALKAILGLSSGASALPKGCAHAGSADAHLCMYPNETLSSVSTPLFAVNQMISVWDAQCQAEGQPVDSILQLACSIRGNFFKKQHMCVQYPGLCDGSLVKDWWVPMQQQYIDDYTRSGVHAKNGNGGFFHQCYLGSYWGSTFSTTYSWSMGSVPGDGPNGTHCALDSTGKACLPRPEQGIWNTITVGGMTMQQAITSWWENDGSTPAPWLADAPWDAAAGHCRTCAVNLPGDCQWPTQPDHPPPVVPWCTSQYMTNPTCRGMPWY